MAWALVKFGLACLSLGVILGFGLGLLVPSFFEGWLAERRQRSAWKKAKRVPR